MALFNVFLSLAVLMAQLLLAAAQDRPNTTTPCDFYTNKTVGENTADNERILMALVLHSALLGPFSKYNTISVAGFTGALTPTTYAGEDVDLNGYFDGAFASANTGGSSGAAVNFLDDGGLEAARNLKPGNGNTTSAQYIFFTHVYSYFAAFLGCSHIGSATLPNYAGKASMYEVHKFMDLNAGEMGFFVDQAVRGLLSIGFSDPDAQFVNSTLTDKFNLRCAPAEAIIPPSAGAQLQAICIAPDCLLSPNDTCLAYDTAVAPTVANATLLGNYTKDANGTTVFNASETSTSTSLPSSTVVSAASSLWRKTTASDLLGQGLAIIASLVLATLLA
ncbi:hypothetical protein CMQ_3843 [Grosmannia clavigera kw1407]|uniref:Uncharacterized protein n=1 Tax=Grosmannia clavigera (strain kw1407 / UAMH 11150) TaxID=655863 RepID=F0XA09_GROCL|nr:uncharacterized protein CMQ_3843 [Grosmannia clavigera kw1407]EFX05774.1 hypothetical protein CMQ_3843 [Grosmannia clavigera kw1407]